MKDVYQKDGRWKVSGPGWTYEGDRVILANGSSASQVPGSDGSGYAIRGSGTVSSSRFQHLQDYAMKCIFCLGRGAYRRRKVPASWMESRFIKNRANFSLDYGILKNSVFQLSRYTVRALERAKKAELSINFFPEYTDRRTGGASGQARQELCPYQSEAELLVGLLPDKLIPCFS